MLLCERFQLPILRINSNYLDKRYRGLDLLSYLVEVWFSAQAFDDAQEQGFVPMDEPFDPAWILSSPGHSNDFPFWLSLDIQVAIQRLYDEGRVFHPGPSHIVALDSNDIYRAIAYFYVTRQHVLVTETAMRGQRFPLVASDFLPDVAIRELYDDLLAYLKGEARAIDTRRFESRLRPYTEDYKLCSSSSWGMPEVNET